MRHQGSLDATFDFPAGQSFQQGSTKDLVAALRDAALKPSSDGCADVVARARSMGLSNDAIRDTIIPTVARDLGNLWCSDGIGFGDVTIAVARLQGLLRNLSANRVAVRDTLHTRSVCVVVPAGAQHTLGATLLVAQLRQRGISVRFLLDATPADLRIALRRVAPDAVFVSCIMPEMLEQVVPIIERVRKHASGTPVVVGGPVTISNSDICSLTGADHASRDIETSRQHLNYAV